MGLDYLEVLIFGGVPPPGASVSSSTHAIPLSPTASEGVTQLPLTRLEWSPQ